MIPPVHTTNPPRFGTAATLSPGRLLLKNSGRILGDYFYGKIHNIQNFKNNAFILSSFIQVSSRIFVANRTAKETQHTPEGPYRYKEAVKTTFREAMGFILSYVVLRAFQRGTVDFLRNYLWVRGGLASKPTLFNGLFRRWFQVPHGVTSHGPSPFPGLWGTAKRLVSQVRDYFGGRLRKVDLMPIEKLFPDVIENRGVVFDARRMAQYRRMEPYVNWVNRLAGKDPNTPVAQKLQTFFDWVPPLVGSIPALFFSGFLLERFSQRYAEGLAEKISGFFNRVRGKSQPPVSQPRPPQIRLAPGIDQMRRASYARRQAYYPVFGGLVPYGFPPPVFGGPPPPVWFGPPYRGRGY